MDFLLIWIFIFSFSFAPLTTNASSRQKDASLIDLKLPLFHLYDHTVPAGSPHWNQTERLLHAAFTRVNLLTSRAASRTKRQEQLLLVQEGDYLQSYQGFFFVTISLGTPPQEFPAVVDTGSSLLWVHCQEKFRTSISSTFRSVPCNSHLCQTDLPSSSGRLLNQTSCNGINACTYELDYGAAMTSGTLSLDTLTLDVQSIPDFAFGCAHEVELTEGTQYPFPMTAPAGLIGLARSPLSLTSHLPHKRFAYCLNNADQFALSYGKKLDGGFLTFGKSANSNDFEHARYTPLVKSMPFYYINLQGLSVAGKRLPISSNVFSIDPNNYASGTIIDTGSTLTLLPRTAYEALRTAIQKLVPYTELVHQDPDGNMQIVCYNVGRDAKAAFGSVLPPVTFHFEGADIQLPANNTYVMMDSSTACLTIVDCGGCVGSLSIIGNVHQQHFNVLFDLDEERVGFVPATGGDCAADG